MPMASTSLYLMLSAPYYFLWRANYFNARKRIRCTLETTPIFNDGAIILLREATDENFTVFVWDLRRPTTTVTYTWQPLMIK